MKKIIDVNNAALISKESKKLQKKIVLVGGCFDILHNGHIFFLKESKREGDILFVLLESDENIRKRKGEKRPINSQKDRANILSSILSVDYVVLLTGMTKNEDYDKLIVQIEPDIIALTKGDKYAEKRQIQSDLVRAKLVQIDKVDGLSTSQFAENIN